MVEVEEESWTVVLVATRREGGYAGQLVEMGDLPGEVIAAVRANAFDSSDVGKFTQPVSGARLSDVLRQLASRQATREEHDAGISRLREMLTRER